MSRKDGRPRSVAITLPLDPQPWIASTTGHRLDPDMARYFGDTFAPRPGYSQNQEDYA